MHRQFGCAAVIKGGHLKRFNESADIFYDGDTELLLTAPRVRGVKLHGTGCTFSAAVAAHLAHGRSLPEAVARAKQFVTAAIANNKRVGS
jgi:hydroxymethylpyrimidine/phosphomethylpyrimidine kinase